jgi:2-polyprenyl-3-methyl-5-hydroxy-6-metoxy-1,4-benzoquinol methylase
MLALARQRLREQPLLEGRLSFQQALLPCPELAGGFSAVVSNSLLHHLHNPQVLWQALRQLGAPGTCIYMKDLRRPGSSAMADELRQRYLAEAPPVLQRDYTASLHAAFRPEEVELQLAAAGLHSLRVEPLEDRYLEVWGQLT